MSAPVPEENPFDAYAREQEGHEIDEQAKLTTLLETLHLLYAAAAETDNGTDDLRQHLGSLAVSMGNKRNTWPGNNPNIMPSEFDEMLWTPRPNTFAAVSLEKVMVRFPQLRGEEFSVFDPDQIVVPRDIFIELVFKSGDTHRYLVNDHEVSAYPDAESVEFYDDELLDPMRDNADEPNTFRTLGKHWYAPSMDAELLNTLLLKDSTFGPFEQLSA